jgi:PAS domain S-box-containing protein
VATKQRQRLLADASDCGVAIVAGAHETLGVVLDANAPFGRIMGMTTGQLVGSPLMALVADSDADRMRTTLERVARGGMQTLEVTLRGRLVGGRRAEVAVRADPDGAEPRELIVRVRDITEQMRLVAELSGAVGRLERTNHELAEFARVTAHDLSAPLLAASRLLDLVPDSSSDPDAPATLDAIRSAINRMRVMVDGVMGYAESLEAAPARPPVELSEPLQRVLDTLAEEIDRRQAVISVGKLPTVPGDEQQLERVFLNLISNALKFADDQPPRVRIEAHHEHATWRISVSDEGIGVPQTDGARIFELFGRSEATTSGRGIGLATCRRIVELHGGQIWVEPNEPSGSVFYFTLPTEPTVSSS